ncbi:MAG: hypothetical protein H0X25_11000 [Acidobacteriales bacterium]|nr:hypothetical protein [Terriglobales bacterium]
MSFLFRAVLSLLLVTFTLATSAPAQSFSVLYSFQNGPDGASPDKGRLIGDGVGNLYGTTYAGGKFFQGTIFKLDAAGQETVLYHFKGARDGAGPIGSLVRDRSGNLYGTTSYAGNHNAGTIFQLSSNSTFRVLHAFDGAGDGGQPYAGMVLDQNGNFIGTTRCCGDHGNGTIFRITPTGQYKVLYAFQGSPDGAQSTAGLVRDGAGNYYGTTSVGGLFGYGTVFVFDKNKNEKVLHDFTGFGDGIAPLSGVVLDGLGNLYGATSAGGSFNNGMMYVLDTATGVESIYLTFGGTDGAYPVGDLIIDDAGTLYGTTANGGDFGQGLVFEVSSRLGFIVLHSFNSSDGYQPYAGLTRDHVGNLYGTTRFGGADGSGVIYKIAP